MSSFFTYEERLLLQKYLKEGLSFKKIAGLLGKNDTTISREVRKHMKVIATSRPGCVYNPCRRRSACKRRGLCRDCRRSAGSFCRFCQTCRDVCPDYIEEVCTARFHVPYVCNGCSRFPKCPLAKNFYDAEKAHLEAHASLSAARSGLCVSEQEISHLNAVISPLVKQGQSIHQIYLHHRDELMCCEKTVYNYIDACLMDVRNIDLPRKVRFRQRYKKPEFKVDRGCRIGRSYADFQRFLGSSPETAVVQMDSVIGTPGGKSLLTVHFVESSFMLAFLRDANTSQSVIDIFDGLYSLIGADAFTELFPLILTDNGSEFSNPKRIEFGPSGKGHLRTRVFYCDAGSPFQKGAIEVNHELIRRIIPKGKSFDSLTQEDVMLMMNHINSYKRKKLNNRSPYDAFSFFHGEGTAGLLGCSPVAPGDIVLKPALLQK